MELLDNTQMSGKLIGSFFIMAILLGGVAVVGYFGMKSISAGADSIYFDGVIPIKTLSMADSSYFEMRENLLRYIVFPDDRVKIRVDMKDEEVQVNKWMSDYRKTDLSSSEKEALAKFDEVWTKYQDMYVMHLDDIDSGKEKMVIESMRSGAMAETRQNVIDAFHTLGEINQNKADLVHDKADVIFSGATLILIIAGIISVIIALGFGYIISRSITDPLKQTVIMLEEMSLGHLQMRLSLTRKDEIGDLAHTMDQFADDLHNVVVNGMKQIAAGDFSHNVVPKDENDEISPAMQEMLNTLNGLVTEVSMLTDAAIMGDLKTRGDADKFQGGYRSIIEGINETLEEVILPLNEAIRISRKYAGRNFAARFNPVLVLHGDFAHFREVLENIGVAVSDAVNLINTQMNDLISGAEQTGVSIKEVSLAAGQVAENAAAVNANAEESKEGITQILQTMEDLNTTVTQVSMKTDQVLQLATEADTLSKSGAELAGKAEQGMIGINEATQEVGGIISDIRTQMADIDKIVNIIGDIAEQTNLLALNAAIEAARAGEAGAGFGVVADEVKSLALQSRKSAENIASIIEGLQRKSEIASAAMERSQDEVKSGSQAVSDTLSLFNEIVSAITRINSNISEVASATEEQAASVSDVTTRVHEIAEKVQDTAKEAGNAAAASEEASATIAQIVTVIGSLTESIDQIGTEMKRFNTG